MANPTTNYGWPMPTSADLVTDLPADFALFGQPVDTSLKALNPETTLGDIAYRSSTSNTNTRLGIGTNGQVLAVSGGVPAWTTTADVTPLTTKGDLFTFSTVDARLGVGSNDQILVADSAEATGLKWATPASAGGMTLLSTTSLSGGTTSLTSISGAYVNLALFIVNFYASSASTLTIQVNSQTTNYANIIVLTSDVTTNTVPGLTTAMRCTNESAVGTTNTNNQIALTFPNYAASTGQKIGTALSSYTGSGGDKIIENGATRLPITAALTQIDIKTSAGTWSGGTAYLYGVK